MLIWGAGGGLGGFALQYVLSGGGYARVRRLEPGEGAEVPRGGRRVDHRPRGARTSSFWDPETGQQNPQGGLRLGKTHPRADRRPRRRHRLRAPRPRHVRRERVRHAPRRQGRHLRLDDRLHARVRQPLPVDVREDDRRLAPRQLPRGLGRQRALPRGPHAPDPQSKTYPLSEAGQAADDVHDNAHLGKVGVLCLAPEAGRGRRSTTRCASSTSRRSRATAVRRASAAAVAGCEWGRIVHVTPARADDHGRGARAAPVPQPRIGGDGHGARGAAAGASRTDGDVRRTPGSARRLATRRRAAEPSMHRRSRGRGASSSGRWRAHGRVAAGRRAGYARGVRRPAPVASAPARCGQEARPRGPGPTMASTPQAPARRPARDGSSRREHARGRPPRARTARGRRRGRTAPSARAGRRPARCSKPHPDAARRGRTRLAACGARDGDDPRPRATTPPGGDAGDGRARGRARSSLRPRRARRRTRTRGAVRREGRVRAAVRARRQREHAAGDRGRARTWLRTTVRVRQVVRVVQSRIKHRARRPCGRRGGARRTGRRST